MSFSNLGIKKINSFSRVIVQLKIICPHLDIRQDILSDAPECGPTTIFNYTPPVPEGLKTVTTQQTLAWNSLLGGCVGSLEGGTKALGGRGIGRNSSRVIAVSRI